MKNKLKILISVSLSVVLCFTAFPAAFAAPKAVVQAETLDSPFSVQITTDKSSYGTFDMAKVHIVVTNNSSKPLDDVNVENILPEQLSAFGTDSLNISYSSLTPGDSIEISYEACLNPNKAPVNFLIKLFLKLKIYFKLLSGGDYVPHSDTAVTNKHVFDFFSTTKDITYGKITVINLVKVSYLSLPEGESTGTVADIVTLYNTAANNSKAYVEGMHVTKSSGHSIDSINTDSGIGNLMGNLFAAYNPTIETDVFTLGNTNTKDFLPPSGNEKMSTLTADGVKSASSIMLENNYKLVVINLISEHFTDLNAIPPVHSTCMDTNFLSVEDLSPLHVNFTDKTYTGATIIAVINGGIYLDYVYIKEPIVLGGTMSYSGMPSFSFDILDTWKQNISFVYRFSTNED